MSSEEEIFPVIVFSGTLWEAGLVKSLLENNGIEAFLIDEYTGTIAPFYVAGGGAGSVKIEVANTDLDKALEVIKYYHDHEHEHEEEPEH